jgi:ribosomal protein L7/L12
MGLFTNYSTVLGQLSRVERKLDAVLAHLGVELADDGFNELRDLMNSGEKIAAIRLYRQLTGVGLAEAKATVEQGL